MKRTKCIAVLGAGVMGAGIAQVFSSHGFQVRLFSRRRTRLNEALRMIEARQKELVRNGAMKTRAAERSRQLIHTTTSLPEAIRDVDFVSENITEKLEEKRGIFKRLSTTLPPEVILSTNTSSLPLSSVTDSTKFPERVIGLHWMNPAHLMPIVEVIRAPLTSDATVHATCELAKKAGKTPIVLNRDIPGFVINRLQYALFREAFLLVRKGVIDPAGIDDALKDGLGLRWAILGPFEHMDLSGLDTVDAVAKALFKQLDRSTTPPAMLSKFVKSGTLGIKTGGGFHGLPRSSLERLAERRDDALVALLKSLRKLRRQGNPARST